MIRISLIFKYTLRLLDICLCFRPPKIIYYIPEQLSSCYSLLLFALTSAKLELGQLEIFVRTD